jgi:uncharacterized protein involved in exopolysaccharide biosynthesis
MTTIVSEATRSARVGPAVPPGSDEVSLVGALNTILRRWRVVLGVPVLLAVLTGLVSLVIPPTFSASTSFVPETRSQNRLPSALIGLAGQLGVSIGADPSQSPRFYGDLLTSRELLERTLLSRYPDPRTAGADSASLLSILEVDGKNSADSLARGVKRLEELIAVRVDPQTSVVRVTVNARYGSLAAGIANRLVTYLNEFNTQKRQSTARERRRFSEERVAAADSALRRAEDGIKVFYERNRDWQQSPDLVFEESRLRRQVTVGQELYLTLKREYETARIEEVNDTPVITVIDDAVVPQERSQPRPLLWMIVAFLLGGMMSISWALAATYVERSHGSAESDYRELNRMLRSARHSVGDRFRRLLGRR